VTVYKFATKFTVTLLWITKSFAMQNNSKSRGHHNAMKQQ